MFYSHTFLARKGPLGTVWCAAHLQHKLKKSHYTCTDIPSTVERIMCPEVPIALRMSSHLLLGVVRIYSKKVDYLYQDCNVVLVSLKNAFIAPDVNLPENATQAQFNAVTLPETYDLDALRLYDHTSIDEPDHAHLHSPEDITLIEQVPTDREPYIAITFDDDFNVDKSNSQGTSTEGSDPMQQQQQQSSPSTMGDVRSQDPRLAGTPHQSPPKTGGGSPGLVLPGIFDAVLSPSNGAGPRDPGPSNLADQGDTSPMDIMRDADHNIAAPSLLHVLPGQEEAVPKPIRSPDQSLRDQGILSPINESISGKSLQLTEPNSSVARETPDIFNSHIAFGDLSPALELRPSPPLQEPQNVEAQEPKPKRQRKRKNLIDSVQPPVLTNAFMKQQLECCSDLVKKRKKLPCSAFDLWKQNSKKKKTDIFLEPVISGLCVELQAISKKDFISSKPHLVLSKEDEQEPATAPVHTSEPEMEVEQEPATAPVHTSEPEMEIEQLLDAQPGADINLPEGLMHSPQQFPASPSHPSQSVPVYPESLGYNSEAHTRTSISPGRLPSPDFGTPSGLRSSAQGTPHTDLGRTTAFSDMSIINSADDELAFLDEDNNSPNRSPADSQRTQGSNEDTMSARTRAVAQYFKRHSPMSIIGSGDHLGDLNLNRLLEGRTRKLCARMLSETLVLKSYGLVDVQQEEPYGDITLKLTPAFAKSSFVVTP